MEYYCQIRDKSIKPKSKNKQLHFLTHNEIDECIRIKFISENPNFPYIDLIFNKHITNHKKNLTFTSLNMIFN